MRQLQEKYGANEIVDLEKAYDRVPRAVTSWALRKLGVEEWMVRAVMSMYEETWTVVRTKDGDSERFEVKVGLHQLRFRMKPVIVHNSHSVAAFGLSTLPSAS